MLAPRRLAVALLLFLTALVGLPSGAGATFPGTNGPVLAVTDTGSTIEIDLATGARTVLHPRDILPNGEDRSYSPDGNLIVGQSGGNSIGILAVAPRASFSFDTLFAEGRISHATWSPDQRSIAYTDDGDVYVKPVAGGAAQKIYESQTPQRVLHAYDVDWSVGNVLVISGGNNTYRTLWTMTPTGGNMQVLDFHPLGASNGVVSPDGQKIAFQAVRGNVTPAGIQIAPVAGGTPRLLTGDGLNLTPVGWLPDGTGVVYLQREQLRVINVDGSNDRLITEGGIWGAYDVRPIGGSSGGGSKPTPGPKCGPRTIGPFVATGCFTKKKTVWTAKGSITMNGLTVETGKKALTFDEKTGEIASAGSVVVKLTADTDTLMFTGPIKWNWKRPITIELARPIDIKGLSAKGTMLMRPIAANGGSIAATLNVTVPSINVVAETTVQLSKDGFDLSSAEVSAKDIRIPPKAAAGVTLKSISLKYSEPSGVPTWSGDAEVELEKSLKLGSLRGGATIAGGALTELRGGVSFSAPGRPFGTSGVFLQKIDAIITITPIGLSGEVGLTAGPQIKVGDKELAAVSGTIGLGWSSNARCKDAPKRVDSGNVFTFTGKLEMVELLKFDGELCAMLNGWAQMNGTTKAKIKWLEIEGKSNGWISSKAFSAITRTKATFKFDPWGPGSVEVSREVSAVLTSKGMGACGGSYTYFPTKKVDLGFRYNWKKRKLSHSCNTKPIEVRESAALVRAGSDVRFLLNTTSTTVPTGSPEVVFEIEAAPGGGFPRAVVTAPDGSSMTTPSAIGADDESGGLSPASGDVLFTSGGDASTVEVLQVIVTKPAAGRWNIAPAPGTLQPAAVLAERVLPAPTIAGTVKRAAKGKLTASWRASSLEGATVSLSEEAYGIARVLGSSKKVTGKLTFLPTAGTATKRQIWATIERDGVPLTKVRLGAAFQVKAPARLKAVRKFSVKRTKTGPLQLTWTKLPGATEYVVVVTTGKGRSSAFTAIGTKLTVRNAVAHGARVSIVGRDKFGRTGAVKTVRAPR